MKEIKKFEVLYEFQIGDTGLGGAADTLQARGG